MTSPPAKRRALLRAPGPAAAHGWTAKLPGRAAAATAHALGPAVAPLVAAGAARALPQAKVLPATDPHEVLWQLQFVRLQATATAHTIAAHHPQTQRIAGRLRSDVSNAPCSKA